MQFKIFNIPISETGEAMSLMNQFLRAHKVLEVGQEMIQNERGASWCFCVRYIEGAVALAAPPLNGSSKSGVKPKVDYLEVLDEPTFAIFSKLRECRKQIAESEAIPAYFLTGKYYE